MPDPIGGNGAPLFPSPKMFRTLAVAASGLTAQRTRMDVIATNVANASTTRTADGGPYRRRVVELGAGDVEQFAERLVSATQLEPAAIARVADVPNPFGEMTFPDATGVRVTNIAEDPGDGPRVYEPGHPDADADGYVTYPNVRVTDEMVDLMDARRLFEANATVFQTAKSLLRRSIDI